MRISVPISWVAVVVCGSLLGSGCGGDPPHPDPEPARESPRPAVEVPATEKHFEFESYAAVEKLFEELSYTPETWRAGIRQVPRVYLTTVPTRWRDRVSKDVSVQTKKRIFFRAMAPLVLRTNELILGDRERARRSVESAGSGPLEPGELAWLSGLAVRYGVIEEGGDPLSDPAVEQLMRRVDAVPVSLALSQAAEESGWGTSRFAAEGNALFGQWTWSDSAIKPRQQRSSLGNYGIAAFETPLDSVLAYAHNLNTHRAYRELRKRREERRTAAQPPSGRQLAETLTRYSERGQAYVDTLHTIMNANQLDAADEAYLGDGPTIFLVPVGDGVGS